MQLSQQTPSPTPTANLELSSIERKEVLQETQQSLDDLSENVVTDNSSETNKPTLKGMTDKLSAETNASAHKVTIEIEAACLEFGIDPRNIGTDGDIDKEVLDLARSELTKTLEKEKSDQRLSITSRFTQLREKETPLQSLLETLRAEFKGKIDEETNTVLSRYEALFSEEILPDKEERKAVETLFFSQDVTTFTAASFTGFVHTLYDQPDDVISKETKARIENKFQIPRQRITTGGQLAKAAFAKDEEGNFQHDSPENALQLDNGMSSYVQPNGEAVVSLHTPQSKPRIIYVRSLETWFSADAAKNINYGIIRDAVFDNLDQMTG